VILLEVIAMMLKLQMTWRMRGGVHSSRAGVRRSPMHSAEEWCAQQQSRGEEEPYTLSRGVVCTAAEQG
jgi:hypothetical protein